MKSVVLSCDGCGVKLENISAAHSLFSGSVRRDFCTDGCFNDWARRHCVPGQSTFGLPAMGSRRLKLEQASDWDIWTVWDWNNDPQVRTQSFSPTPIAAETHQKWFPAHQENITMAWLAVGCARVEDGEISVVIDPDHHGKGFGTQLISAVSRHNTVARIKETNDASLRAFAKAGYLETDRAEGIVTMARDGH